MGQAASTQVRMASHSRSNQHVSDDASISSYSMSDGDREVGDNTTLRNSIDESTAQHTISASAPTVNASPRRGGILSSLTNFRFRTANSDEMDQNSPDGNTNVTENVGANPSSISTLQSSGNEAQGSSTMNRRRRRRPSSLGSDEPNSTNHPKRRHRSSLQRIRDSVLSSFSSSSSAASEAFPSDALSSVSPPASSRLDNPSDSLTTTASSSLFSIPSHADASYDAAADSGESTAINTGASPHVSSVNSGAVHERLRRRFMGNSSNNISHTHQPELHSTLSMQERVRRRMNLMRANDPSAPVAPPSIAQGRLAALVRQAGVSDSSTAGSLPNPDRRLSLFPGFNLSSGGSESEGAQQTTQAQPSTFPAAGNDIAGQAAMLSRLLAVAATVTANSLVGNGSRQEGGFSFGRHRMAGSNASEEEEEESENSFGGFLNRLNNGLLTRELSQSLDDRGRTRNFFRMFRFPPSPSENGEDNLIPVLIVGVRAVEQEEGDPSAATNIGGIGAGIFDALSAQPIRLRYGRGRDGEGSLSGEQSASRDQNEASPDSTESVSQESQAAESAQAAQASQEGSEATSNAPTDNAEDDTARSTRDSFLDGVLSGLRGSMLRDRGSQRNTTLSSSSSTSSFTSMPRDTGASTDDDSSRNQQSRRTEPRQSWIVYVVGGTYPGDHPILLAPSLFTDSPLYEDMLILENFLGQAKPPVASKEEVEKSGGVFSVGAHSECSVEDRCLVCLSNYEQGEECRKLNDCGHSFHKECIDQWLTTGRNSCPLCRGEGVKKDAPAPSVSTTSAPPDAPTAPS